MATVPEETNEVPGIVATCIDDADGEPLFTGQIQYADGGEFAIRRDDTGDVVMWPMDLVRIEMHVIDAVQECLQQCLDVLRSE